MLVDTDVMVDCLRGHAPAVQWLTTYSQPVGMPGLVAMELLQGCKNLSEQQRVENELSRFARFWPTVADSERAIQDFVAYRLSHNLGLLDALIGHTAVGLNETLATFNVKHYSVILGLNTIQPY